MDNSKSLLAVCGLVIVGLLIIYALANHQTISQINLPGGGGVVFGSGNGGSGSGSGRNNGSGNGSGNGSENMGNVPSVVGLNVVDANGMLWNAGYKTIEKNEPSSFEKTGIVLKTVPGAGLRLRAGSYVTMYIGRGSH